MSVDCRFDISQQFRFAKTSKPVNSADLNRRLESVRKRACFHVLALICDGSKLPVDCRFKQRIKRRF